MIAVITFRWSKPGYRSTFLPVHVNTLRRMVARHYPHPFRFICVTDDATGLDPEVEHIPLWDDYAAIPNPSWPAGPSCYRRLKVHSEWFAQLIGPGTRMVLIDLDVVITDDLTPILHREEPFLMWETGHPTITHCASMVMATAGAHPEIWDTFDPVKSPRLATQDGRMKGSDQSWLYYVMRKKLAGWGPKHGVYSYRDHCVKQYQSRLPRGARVVMFHGRPDPWDYSALQASPWIHDHYY